MPDIFGNMQRESRAASVVGALTILMGLGGFFYSTHYEHGTGSPEGLERRGKFCQRDYQGCATDAQIYRDCLHEKSILGETARMNSYILFSLGLMILTGGLFAGGGQRPVPPRPPAGPQ